MALGMNGSLYDSPYCQTTRNIGTYEAALHSIQPQIYLARDCLLQLVAILQAFKRPFENLVAGDSRD